MTDKEYEEQKQRVTDLIQPLMNLLTYEWKITVKFERHYAEDDRDTLAEAIPAWEYMNGTLRIYLPAIKDFVEPEDDEYLLNTLLHELVHFITDPIVPRYSDASDEQRKLVEYVTSCLANGLTRMYIQGRNKTLLMPSELQKQREAEAKAAKTKEEKKS